MLTKFDILLPVIQRALNGLTQEAHCLLLDTKKEWQQIPLKTRGTGEDTDYLNWPNWYLMPYGIMLSSKSWRTEAGMKDIRCYCNCICKHIFSQALPATGSGRTPVYQREVMSKFCALLQFSSVCYYWIILILITQPYYLHFISSLSYRRGVCASSQVDVWLLARVNPVKKPFWFLTI